MKKKVVTISIGLVAIFIFTRSQVTSSIIGFLLAGAIPGTSLFLPFWMMMMLYCLTITFIVTAYVEQLFTFTYRHKQSSKTDHKTALPKRRYRHI